LREKNMERQRHEQQIRSFETKSARQAFGIPGASATVSDVALGLALAERLGRDRYTTINKPDDLELAIQNGARSTPNEPTLHVLTALNELQILEPMREEIHGHIG
jgi:hypothetical protein